jgi:hypothetical protein
MRGINVEFQHLQNPARKQGGILGREPGLSMVTGIATVKVTITLQDEKLQEIRALVASGQAASISGFV